LLLWPKPLDEFEGMKIKHYFKMYTKTKTIIYLLWTLGAILIFNNPVSALPIFDHYLIDNSDMYRQWIISERDYLSFGEGPAFIADDTIEWHSKQLSSEMFLDIALKNNESDRIEYNLNHTREKSESSKFLLFGFGMICISGFGKTIKKNTSKQQLR
jgi:hypothetical protein